MLKAISKISLCVYIVHYSIGVLFAYNRQSDMELSNFAVLFFSICAVVPSIIVAFFLMAAIEIPVFNLRKHLFR